MIAPSELNLGSVATLLQGVSGTATVAAVKAALRDPSANSRLSLLILSVAVLLVILLVAIVLLIITPSRKRVVKIRRYASAEAASKVAEAEAAASETPVQERKPPGRLFMVLTGPAMVASLAVIAFIGIYAATSLNAFCAKTCHAPSESVHNAADAGHAACVSCHESGWLALVSNTSARSRMAVDYAMRKSASNVDTVVDSSRCLSCHGDIDKGVFTSAQGLRMSHKEVIQAAWPCVQCHASAGHGSSTFSGSMSTCLPCHDAKTASAECKTCHTMDPSSVALATSGGVKILGNRALAYPAVRAANRNCGGCHDQARECDTCHGLRMPHSQAFKDGAHARPAAFDLKVKYCWKCHEPMWCSVAPCHIHGGAFDPMTGNTSHPGDWKQEHKTAAWDAGCVCHQSRTLRTRPICTLCHAADHSLLPIRQ